MAGYEVRDVKGDGGCYYRCLSVYFTGTEDNYNKYRREVVGYLREHSDNYSSMIRSEVGYASTSDYFSRKMRTDHQEFAETTEIIATCCVYNINVHVLALVPGKRTWEWLHFDPSIGSGKPSTASRDIYLYNQGSVHFMLCNPKWIKSQSKSMLRVKKQDWNLFNLQCETKLDQIDNWMKVKHWTKIEKKKKFEIGQNWKLDKIEEWRKNWTKWKIGQKLDKLKIEDWTKLKIEEWTKLKIGPKIPKWKLDKIEKRTKMKNWKNWQMKKQEEQNRYIEVRLRLALKQEIKNTYVMIVWTSNYFANKVILAKWLLFMLKTFVEK